MATTPKPVSTENPDIICEACKQETGLKLSDIFNNPLDEPILCSFCNEVVISIIPIIKPDKNTTTSTSNYNFTNGHGHGHFDDY